MRACFLLAAALLLAVSASAQTPQPAPTAEPTQLERGAARYQRYCSACHGADASGNGPMASSLRSQPSDLRGIAKRRGGFDRPSVAATIDGRSRSQAHGSQDSPVWGWRGLRARKGSAGVPSAPMLEILAYLESIQVPPLPAR